MNAETRRIQAARIVKADRILAAFADHLGPDVDEPTALAVAEKAPASLWADLAEVAGTRPPSESTIGLVIGTLRVRTTNRNTDPFVGLG